MKTADKKMQPDKSTFNLPLCVDLDGTLMHSDALWESAVRSFFRAPFQTLASLPSIRQGRAIFKERMLRHGEFDVALLPYNQPLIDRLKKEKASGRKVFLVTAADQRVADSVSAHLGLFDKVYASESGVNLKGPNKAALLADVFGEAGFIYVGDSDADNVVWQRSAAAWAVGEKGASTAAATGVPIEEKFAGSESRVSDWIEASRSVSWASNLLIFMPLIVTGQILNPQAAIKTFVAFMCLCATAFGAYLLSDLANLDSDRNDPEKRLRPVAAGRISLLSGGMISAGLSGLGILIGLLLNPVFAGLLLAFALSIFMLPKLEVRHTSAAVAISSWLNYLRILAGILVASIITPSWFWVLAAPLCVIVGLFTKRAATP